MVSITTHRVCTNIKYIAYNRVGQKKKKYVGVATVKLWYSVHESSKEESTLCTCCKVNNLFLMRHTSSFIFLCRGDGYICF